MSLSLLHEDTFNRADASLSGATMSDGVGVWTVITRTWDVVSNKASKSGGDGALIRDSAMSGSSTDQAAEIACDNDANGVFCRRTTVGSFNSFYLAYIDGSAKLNLYRNGGASAGDYTQIAGPGSTTVGAGVAIKVEAIGTTIKGYVGGVEELSVTDSNLASGDCGISGNTAADRTYDSFRDYVDAGGGFSSAFFRENAGAGAVGGGPFARANAGAGAV